MRIARKQILAVVMVIACSMPISFTLMIMLRREHVKREMREGLENSPLQTITVSAEKVQWVEEHEIWVNNKMFDIQTKKLENGIYTFTGLYDDEETAMFEMEEEQPIPFRFLSQLFKTFPVFFHPTEYNEPQILFKKIYTHFYPAHLPARYQPILTPPPQDC